MPVRLVDGHAVAVKRFDRERAADASDCAQSAHVALRAAEEPIRLPRARAIVAAARAVEEGDRNVANMHELFRRMVFNILIDNTDDHEKNHVLLIDDAQHDLAPAFDVLPTGQALGYQQMRVGRDAADSTIENAMSEAALFGLSAAEARAEASEVAAVCGRWRPHFAKVGVSASDIDYLSQFIDRAFLLEQRSDLMKRVARIGKGPKRKR